MKQTNKKNLPRNISAIFSKKTLAHFPTPSLKKFLYFPEKLLSHFGMTADQAVKQWNYLYSGITAG